MFQTEHQNEQCLLDIMGKFKFSRTVPPNRGVFAKVMTIGKKQILARFQTEHQNEQCLLDIMGKFKFSRTVPPNRGVFAKVMTIGKKQILARVNWNPKRKMYKLTMHISEMI